MLGVETSVAAQGQHVKIVVRAAPARVAAHKSAWHNKRMNAPVSPSLPPHLARLTDPAYWRGIAPRLHVGDSAFDAEQNTPIEFSPEAVDSIRADLAREGYFQLPPQAWGFDVADVAEGVRAVGAAGFLPVFIFMYDEAWAMFARLRNLLMGALGKDYKIVPAFWAWHVDGAREAAGWGPHRDLGHFSLMANKRPKSLTMWLPLTDATTENGCMYVVPADRDKFYGTPREHESPISLQDVRALPTDAGGVLGWTQALYHWGGRARTPVTSPRISMSVEFQRGDQEIYEPKVNPGKTLEPELRLRLIMRQILQYQHMYPLSPELRAFAETIAFKSGLTPAFAAGQAGGTNRPR